MVVDLHSHVLPGVDDGAPDLATAVALCQAAADEGISTIVATPHTFDGVYDVSRERARAAHAELTAALAERRVPITVRLAGEVHLSTAIEGLLRDAPDASLDGQRRYLLLELPQHSVPPTLPQFLFKLRAAGTTPLIAHPERNLVVRDDPEVTAEWVRLGALLQLTAGSLDGRFGPKIGAVAERLLQSGRVHVIATDTHSLHKRPPRVREALARAAAIVGKEGAQALVERNPALVLQGAPAEEVEPPRPARPTRRRRLFAWRRS